MFIKLFIAFTILSCLHAFKITIKIDNEHHYHRMRESGWKYEVKWFNQKVDHFNYINEETFKQRYIISTENWVPNGPIWFYCGNEGDIFTFANNTGFMWENAKDFKAMVVFMEHRYYGQSMPFGNKSLDGLTNAGYLSVEQALADYAEFIQWLKLNTDGAKDSPVVVMGGSYGGMLASWFRMKYPHLTVGALAASAPILQFPGLYNCEGYNRIATKDFSDYSTKCSQSIKNSWAAIRRIAQSEQGYKMLSETFALCSPLTNQRSLQSLIDWLIDIWGTLPMIDYPNPANFLSPLPAYPIKVACQHLTEPNADDETLIRAVAKAASVYTNYTGELDCNTIESGAEERLGTNSWDFQTCTEMVLPQCADGVHDMFEPKPWNFTTFSQNCHKKWNTIPEKFKALMLFGGRHIESASNIIFSNGLRDPWSAGGVLETLSDTLIAIKIPGACHHEDLRERGPNDPPQLLEAREQELKIIRRWLEDFYFHNMIPNPW